MHQRLEVKMVNEPRKENLKIANFAGIKHLDIDLGNLTLLLGPQAVGKSIALKIIYFFRNLRSYILDFYTAKKEDNEKKLSTYLVQKFFNFFPPECYIDNCNEKTLIKYSFYHLNELQEWTIRRISPKQFSLKSSVSFERIDQSFDDAKKRFEGQEKSSSITSDEDLDLSSEKKPLRFLLNEGLYSFFPNEMKVFIPAGRSFFANIDNNIWAALSENVILLDPILTDFGKIYSTFKNFYKSWELSSDLIKNILNGVYISESGHDYIQQTDKRKIEIHRASSAQQELLPLAIALEVLENASFSFHSISIYIEEPEAHLFPEAQRQTSYKIAKVLNKLVNQQGSRLDVRVFLSTHSPYVMSAFNNLLQAGKIANESQEKENKINEIIPAGSFLRPGTVQAYFLGEESTSIFDDDGLIDIDQLESASINILDDYQKIIRV